MKIQIREDHNIEEMEINVVCPKINMDVERVISMLRILDLKLTGSKDGELYILDASKVLYIDTVDKRTFFYTSQDTDESTLKLYSLEEQLASLDFIRANKSCIINFNQIKAIRADLDGKLLVTLNNDEKLYISRQYAPIFKNKLGVK